MTKTTTKIAMASVAGFISGYLLAMVTGMAKLVSLGKTAWEGDAHLLFVPVAHIQNSAKGFVLRSSYGVFVIALAFALVAAVVMYRHLQGRQKPASR